MVPEGWVRRNLDQVADVRTGVAKGKTGLKNPVSLPYLRVANVQDGYLDLTEMKEIEVEATDVERYSLRAGDIVLTEGGDFDKLGRGTIWRGQVSNCLHQNHVFAVRVTSPHLMPEFFAMQAGSKYGRDYFLSCAKRSTNLASINSTQLKQFPVLLPPLPEQQKIAEILGTWDKAIETTEALLANARTQKRALMQSLLTGTRRFPGFEDHPWREVRLGDVLREVNKPVDWSDDELYRLVSVRRRSGGVFHREDLYGHQILTKTLKHAHAGDFLISKMQVVHGAMALVTPEFDGMQISGSYISLVSKDHTKLDIRFFDWLSRTQDMYRRAYQCSYGVHIEKMTFNFGLFLKETVPMPSSVDEQIMIVDALDTAQAEERWFEGEAERLSTEKKSLMQQLLTGKRRVVV